MRITEVEKNSIGDELGIRAGDELIAFNGKTVQDFLDYEFYNAEESFTMSVGRNGQVTDYEIEKDSDEDLGLGIEGEQNIRVCRNKCIFCFVDQLPKKGLRSTLRVKDDDYRLSFMSGSYVTLTNTSEEDLQRIADLKLSPIYVSVHTSDLKLRRFMLGNPKAPDIIEQLRFLHNNGIKIHAQIVYCPEVNEDYVKTIIETAPYCETIAVVPVGLTRDCNTSLKPVDKHYAQKAIDGILPLQKDFLKSKGTRYVFLADEFFVVAEREVQAFECYEDFAQIENGVGLVAKFRREVDLALAETEQGNIGKCSIATGLAAFGVIKSAADKVAHKFGGEIAVYGVKNDFFGESVTVAGLLTGGDIYKTLKNKSLGERLILPRCMLKEFDDVFLDNMTVGELSEKLGLRIQVINTDGYAFVKGCVER